MHEYGGGAYIATPAAVFFSNFADQRLYTLRAGQVHIAHPSTRTHKPTRAPPMRVTLRAAQPRPVPLTPPSEDRARRFADFAFDQERNCLYAVQEDHSLPVRTLYRSSYGRSCAGCAGRGREQCCAHRHRWASHARTRL